MGNKGNHQHYAPRPQQMVYSEMYKITFDGYNGVGKTSIMRKYLEGKLYNQQQATYIVHPYFIYTFGFPMEGRNIGVQVFDCKTNGNFGSAAPFICRRTDVFIFVYDISDKSTFVTVKKNMAIYKDKFEEKDALIIIVGNKMDLPRREVQRNDGENFAKEFNASFVETSTLTGEGINQLFDLVINNIVQRVRNEYHPNQGNNNLTLGASNASSMAQAPNPTGLNTPIEKPNINNNNNIINSQQNNYEKLYNEEKLKNEELEKNITKLQNVNEYLEKELKTEREKNFNASSKENTSNVDPNKIIKLYDEISENQKEIKNLKAKLERFPFDLCENEKIMSVIISTEDKNTQYSVIGKNTDKFLRIEEKFYDAFPEFGKVENSFSINGNKINKYQTLEENGIKNSELIIIKKEDN